MSNNENDPIEDTEEAQESSSTEDDHKNEETEVSENELNATEKEPESSLADASPDDLMDILKVFFQILYEVFSNTMLNVR